MKLIRQVNNHIVWNHVGSYAYVSDWIVGRRASGVGLKYQQQKISLGIKYIDYHEFIVLINRKKEKNISYFYEESSEALEIRKNSRLYR